MMLRAISSKIANIASGIPNEISQLLPVTAESALSSRNAAIEYRL